MKAESKARANARIRKLLLDVHAKIDELNAGPIPRAHVTCSAGCGHARTGCCSLFTTLDFHEAALIVDRNAEAVERALPRLLEAERRIAAAGITVEAFDMRLDAAGLREVERVTSARYRRLELPCAFLDDESRCTIYRDRPLACRTHHVISDPAECSVVEPDEGETDDRYIRVDFGEARARAPEVMIRAQLAARLPIEWSALPLAVLAVYRRRKGEP